MSIFGKNDIFPSVNIVLPLGISFYTLQATGYLIDVYRNVVRGADKYFPYIIIHIFLSAADTGSYKPIWRFI